MKKKNIIKTRVLFATLSLLCLSVFLTFFTLSSYFHKTFNILEEAEISTVEYQSRIIQDTLNSIAGELDFLSTSDELQIIQKAEDRYTTDEYYRESSAYARLVDSRNVYDQIRLIDSRGMEIIRVNREAIQSFIVPEEQLQNKSARYYFKETMALAEGELYISPFDLNIEHGEIEIPEKPMIRFGIPLFDDEGNKTGIIIINYLGRFLIDKLAEISNVNKGRTLLANEAGQWIIGPDPGRDWEFMYDVETDFTMERSLPRSIRLISGREEYQFIEGDFLFTYRKIPIGDSANRSWHLYSMKDIIEYQETMRTIIIVVVLSIIAVILLIMIILSRWMRTVKDRIRWQRKLIEARDRAEKADRDKTAFLAHMSHEIRNPMNAVVGLNRLIKDTDLSEKQRDYVDRSFRASNDLVAIVNDILDFSRIEAGKMNLESIDFNLPDLLKEVTGLAAIIVGEKDKKIEVEMELKPEIPVFVTGDPLRLKQVLTNLMTNAVKFTREGKITLSCSEERRSEREISLLFSVSDTGIGLNEKQQKKLFQTFSQADISTSRTHGGSGLGLSICRQLVRMMGGEIKVDSLPGFGSTFSFNALLAVPPEKVERRVADREISFNRGLKILVVEDNEINQYVAKEILEKEGIIVSQAMDGYEALNLISGKSFNLILMDIQMPGMDGYETAARIRELEPDIPIIALTGELKAVVSEKPSPHLADYMLKPFDSEKLLALIEKWRLVRTIDEVEGLRRLNGNKALYTRLLTMFSSKMSGLKALLEKSDGDEPGDGSLGRELHKLKSSGLGLGAERFYYAAGKMELLLEAGRDISEERREMIDICGRLEEDIERITGNERDAIENTGR